MNDHSYTCCCGRTGATRCCGRGQAWIATLAAAVERRLDGTEPGVGRLVVAQRQGSLTVWQFHREGDLDVARGEAVADLLTAFGFTVTPPRRRRR